MSEPGPASARPLSVAVVGGGVGGLTAAVALRQRGLDVTVYEQADALAEIGAGVLLTPNGVRVLERLGLGDQIGTAGATVATGSTYFRMDGTAIAPILTGDSAGWNGMYGMHRADLLEVLAGALPSGCVRTGHRCVGFDQSDGGPARVAFDNGVEASADVVVAADGIHSRLREEVAPPSAPVASGSVAYRGLIPATEVPFWPRDRSLLWMGEGKHFLVYPVRSGRLINYVGFVPSNEHARESWSAPGDPGALREAFRGWDRPVEALLEAVEDTFWWGLYDREPLTRWSRGRLTLLGDAAHPMLPHLGQGANQSIEDAMSLAVCLADEQGSTDGHEHPTSLDVERRLEVYERVRLARTREVQLGARANGRRYDSAYEDLGQRDAEIVDSKRFRLWLYDHDAEQEMLSVMERSDPALR